MNQKVFKIFILLYKEFLNRKGYLNDESSFNSHKIETCQELVDAILKNKKYIPNYLSCYDGKDWENIANTVTEPDVKLNGYYKHLIYRNDEFEIFLIVWFSNAESPIHNHPEKGCFVKILSGLLEETTFQNIGNSQVKFLETKLLSVNDINFRAGNDIVHRIKNTTMERVVSLHVYLPPNFKSSFFNI